MRLSGKHRIRRVMRTKYSGEFLTKAVPVSTVEVLPAEIREKETLVSATWS